MKILKINSKKNGNLDVLLDDEDYERMQKDFVSMRWATSKCHKGIYLQKRVNKKIILLHRYIMGFPNGIVDHINHNTLDNRKENLRITNNANNLRNGTLRPNNKTGVVGVSYCEESKKYTAHIKVNYKSIYLGAFDTLEEAKTIRKNAEIKYWNYKGDDMV